MKLLKLTHFLGEQAIYLDPREILFFGEDDDGDVEVFLGTVKNKKFDSMDKLSYICDFLKKNNIPFIQLHIVNKKNKNVTMPVFVCINHICYIQEHDESNSAIINFKSDELTSCFKVKEDYEVVLHMYHEALENSSKNRD